MASAIGKEQGPNEQANLRQRRGAKPGAPMGSPSYRTGRNVL